MLFVTDINNINYQPTNNGNKTKLIKEVFLCFENIIIIQICNYGNTILRWSTKKKKKIIFTNSEILFCFFNKCSRIILNSLLINTSYFFLQIITIFGFDKRLNNSIVYIECIKYANYTH